MEYIPFKHKIKISRTLEDCYNFYKNKCIENNKPYISKLDYKLITYKFNYYLSEAIIKESFEYRMPHRLGFLKIKKAKQKFKIKDGKLKPNKKIINWGDTIKLWKEMYPGKTKDEIKLIKGKPLILYTNEHTDGEIMRWFWDKTLTTVKNKTVYVFRAVKANRLNLKDWINDENRKNDYLTF